MKEKTSKIGLCCDVDLGKFPKSTVGSFINLKKKTIKIFPRVVHLVKSNQAEKGFGQRGESGPMARLCDFHRNLPEGELYSTPSKCHFTPLNKQAYGNPPGVYQIVLSLI